MAVSPEQPVAIRQTCIAVFWPSFGVAILASGLFFSIFNPQDLLPFEENHEISLIGIYTIGFFLFWALAALSSLGTFYFTLTNSRLEKK